MSNLHEPYAHKGEHHKEKMRLHQENMCGSRDTTLLDRWRDNKGRLHMPAVVYFGLCIESRDILHDFSRARLISHSAAVIISVCLGLQHRCQVDTRPESLTLQLALFIHALGVSRLLTIALALKQRHTKDNL